MEPADLSDPRSEPDSLTASRPPHAHADALPYALPRLSILHLLGLTAATAAAFMPFQLELRAMRRLAPASATNVQSVTMTGMSTFYGIAWGVCLFVAVCEWHWKRRGWRDSLAPGHWFAFSGAAQWLSSIMSSLLLSTWTPNTSSFALLIGMPRLIIGFCFFLCFMWLALHGRHSPRWRTAFATAALTPVIVWFSTMALAFMGARPSTPFTFMIPQLLMAGIEGLALAAAMIGDWRADAPRHWSHWLGAGSRLSVMAMTTGLYAVYVLFPAVLMGR